MQQSKGKPVNIIESAYHMITDLYRRQNNLPPLAKETCSLCKEPVYLDGLCYQHAVWDRADEDEPDPYRDGDGDEAENHRLDDPRHGQADEINRQR